MHKTWFTILHAAYCSTSHWLHRGGKPASSFSQQQQKTNFEYRKQILSVVIFRVESNKILSTIIPLLLQTTAHYTVCIGGKKTRFFISATRGRRKKKQKKKKRIWNQQGILTQNNFFKVSILISSTQWTKYVLRTENNWNNQRKYKKDIYFLKQKQNKKIKQNQQQNKHTHTHTKIKENATVYISVFFRTFTSINVHDFFKYN